jgi:ferredoxin-NADP reductase
VTVVDWQPARVVAIEGRTPGIKGIFLELERPMAFMPGQHLDIRLVAPDGYEARRSYSIASAPEQAQPLELAVDRLEDGEVSPFLHDELQVGDTIEVRGPIGGHFIWTVDDAAPVLLVGGGSGIVPLMSMIRHHALRGSSKRVVLIAAARTASDLPFREELETLDERNDAFSLLVTLTREAATAPRYRAGRPGRELLLEALQAARSSPATCFVCGSNAFVETMAGLLLELGVEARRIRTERYGG